MALLQVVRMGDPVLRQTARPVADPKDPAIAAMAADMIETMADAPGVGLAAPQIGESLRMIVMRVIADRSDVNSAEPPRSIALINPEIEFLGSETELGWEGCLSVPELRGVVPRASHIAYRGILPGGKRIKGEATGFQARILQHEFDHLNGILYLDRMRDFQTLGYNKEVVAAQMAKTPVPDLAE
jgi:peptide deformylase